MAQDPDRLRARHVDRDLAAVRLVRVSFAKGADSIKWAACNVGFLGDLPAPTPRAVLADAIAGGCYPAAPGGTPITATLTNAVATY